MHFRKMHFRKVRLIVLWAVRGCHSCFVNCRSASPDNCKLTLRKRTIRTEDKPGRFFHEFRHLRESASVMNFIDSLKLSTSSFVARQVRVSRVSHRCLERTTSPFSNVSYDKGLQSGGTSRLRFSPKMLESNLRN